MLRRFGLILGLTLVPSVAHAQGPSWYRPPPQTYGPQGQQPGYQPVCDPVDDDVETELDEKGCPKKKKDKPLEEGSVFGVRVAMTTTAGAETNGTFGAATVGGNSEQFRTSGYLTVHGSSYAFIGGGSAGFEGGFGGLMTFGVRAPITKTQGPFARIGLGGELQGNKRFYYSRFALPIAELGYQYQQKRTVLELGLRGAPILTGRYNSGHRTRRETGDGSLEWGGYLAAHSKYGRIDASYMRIEADDNFPGGPITTLRGTGCVYVSRVGICLDGMYVRGDAYFSLPTIPVAFTRDVRSFYGGLTIGVIDL